MIMTLVETKDCKNIRRKVDVVHSARTVYVHDNKTNEIILSMHDPEILFYADGITITGYVRITNSDHEYKLESFSLER